MPCGGSLVNLMAICSKPIGNSSCTSVVTHKRKVSSKCSVSTRISIISEQNGSDKWTFWSNTHPPAAIPGGLNAVKFCLSKININLKSSSLLTFAHHSPGMQLLTLSHRHRFQCYFDRTKIKFASHFNRVFIEKVWQIDTHEYSCFWRALQFATLDPNQSIEYTRAVCVAPIQTMSHPNPRSAFRYTPGPVTLFCSCKMVKGETEFGGAFE